MSDDFNTSIFSDPGPHPGSTESMTEGKELLGAVIGPYKLLQEIGEGGMGTVYMAEQEKPVSRRVALKIIKPGMDSRQVVARFEAERQALSMMDHVNIAHVLDVGTTEQGRPYFVMELIKGMPITRYCDDKNLTIKERLQLFKSVCNAAQHAHQKGIIHRDLKPSNILVAEYDGKAIPKIIDFGLAKALHQRLTDKTMFTQFGQVVGTLEYMSPEQSRMNQLELDTRTDIYSLGVLLYELLTGTVPFDKKRLRSAALDQVLKIIREEEPPKPSLRLSTMESSVEMASHRGVEPKRLGLMLRGDLDWIVMKAMEKDRNRRYETANGFGMDIERYLDGDPVTAAPPSASYRLKKFVRRNRAAAIAGSLVFSALLIAIVGTSYGMFRAKKGQEAAETARTDEAKAKDQAILAADREREAKVQVQNRLSQIRKANELLSSIFADLDLTSVNESDPLREALITNLDFLSELQETRKTIDQKGLLLMGNIGSIYLQVGQVSKALPFLEKAYQGTSMPNYRRRFGIQLFSALVKSDQNEQAATLNKELSEDLLTQSSKPHQALVTWEWNGTEWRLPSEGAGGRNE